MPAVEIITHIFQLVVAATDTTRSLITNCVYRLLEQRDQWESVLADRSLLSMGIEESLRLDSPAQFMVRSVVEEVTVGSCAIDPGHKVYLNIQSANHDEQRWGEDSRRFRVDRPGATAHLAFGRGIHACIGAPLARIEARTAIAALLDTYPDMTLAPGARWVKCPGALTRRVHALPVLLTGKKSP
jgi:cytochrome P450